MKSRARIIASFALASASVLAVTAGMSYAGGKDQTVLRGDVMVGVTTPYTGPTNPIRGINGGGVPWAIGDAEFRLRASGRLEIEVEGLVVVASGLNPAATFKATVSCQTIDATGAAVVQNVVTDPFPADTAGNAEVETKVDLPSPCIAPIIFVNNGNAAGAWFAATGV